MNRNKSRRLPALFLSAAAVPATLTGCMMFTESLANSWAENPVISEYRLLKNVGNHPASGIRIDADGRLRVRIYYLVPRDRPHLFERNYASRDARLGEANLPLSLWDALGNNPSSSAPSSRTFRTSLSGPGGLDESEYRADWHSIQALPKGTLFLPRERVFIALYGKNIVAPRYGSSSPVRRGHAPQEALLGPDRRIYLKYADGQIRVLREKTKNVYIPEKTPADARIPDGAKKQSLEKFDAPAVIRLHYIAHYKPPDRNPKYLYPMGRESVSAIFLDEEFFKQYIPYMKNNYFAGRTDDFAAWKKRIDEIRRRKNAMIYTLEIRSHPGGTFMPLHAGKRVIIAIAMPFAIVGDIITAPFQACIAFGRGYAGSMSHTR